MAETDSTATIESAIAHLPDDAPDLAGPDPDLAAADDSGDTANTADLDPVVEDAPAPEPESAAVEEPAAVAAPVKKNPKYVPWDRFDAQTKGKQEALKQAADLQAKYDALEQDVAAIREKATAYDVIESNPDVAVEALLKDDRYGKLLTRRQAEALVEAAQADGAAEKAGATVAEAPAFPQPDVELSDGSLTYRPETLEKFMRDLASHTQRTLESKVAALEESFGKRVAPFEEQVVNERLAKDSLKARGAELAELTQTFGAEVMATEKPAMLAWLRDQWGNPDANGRPTTTVKNKKAGLTQAMYAVLIPALKAQGKAARDEALKAADTAKARAIAEQNTRAAAAGDRPSAAGVSKEARPRSPEDIINAAIDRHGLAAA